MNIEQQKTANCGDPTGRGSFSLEIFSSTRGFDRRDQGNSDTACKGLTCSTSIPSVLYIGSPSVVGLLRRSEGLAWMDPGVGGLQSYIHTSVAYMPSPFSYTGKWHAIGVFTHLCIFLIRFLFSAFCCFSCPLISYLSVRLYFHDGQTNADLYWRHVIRPLLLHHRDPLVPLELFGTLQRER